MFQGINAIAQIILSSGAVIILIILFLIIYKKGIKVGYNKNIIQIGRSTKDIILEQNEIITLSLNDFNRMIEIIMDSVKEILILTSTELLNRKMSFAEKKINELKKLKDRVYKEILKSKTKVVAEDSLEFRYFQVMIACMIQVSDDGQLSFKDIIRKELRTKEYHKDGTEYEEYIKNVIDIFISTWRRNLQYFYNWKEEEHAWFVVYDDLRLLPENAAHMLRVEKLIRDIFAKAKDLDEEIKKEEEILEEKRKNIIKNYFFNKSNKED